MSLVALREAGGEGNVALPQTAPRSPRPAQRLRGRLWGPGVAVASLTVLVGVTVLLAPSRGPALGRSRSPASPPAPSASAQATARTGDGQQQVLPGPIAGSRFAPGACVAFPPTGTDRHRTVFLDPGHGGPDPGTIGVTQDGRAVDEAALTLATTLAAVPLLQTRGYRVVVSRTGTSAVAVVGEGDLLSGTYTAQGALKDWTARAACANLARAAALVGVHFNAGGSPRNAGMLTVYDDIRPFSARSSGLASLLHTEILASMNGKGWEIPDAGVMTDGSAGAPAIDAAGRAYGRLVLLGPAAGGYLETPSEMPGAIVEPLFLTAPFEASVAASAAGQQAIAAGIARAVDTFLGAGG